MLPDSAKEISKKSKSSFYYAFSLLPAPKRDAMNTIYAFCRKTDDIVDEGTESNEQKSVELSKWRSELEKAIKKESEHSLLNKTADTINQFGIPIEHFYELIKGMEMDLERSRYNTFDELYSYCYRVASTVGLMCIEIFGYKHSSAHGFALNLGIALQLTNIIRDVAKDAKYNRIYIPLDEIKRFNYSEEDLLSSKYNEQFTDLMEFQAKRAREYFDKASAMLNSEDRASMFAARAMQIIYNRILEKIIKAKYDVFSKDISISKIEKIGIALGVWAKSKLIY